MASIHSLPSLADVDRQTIDEIAGALTAGWPVESIILYGSKARGDDTPESDIDLLVLTSRPLTAEEIGRMRAVARQVGLARECLDDANEAAGRGSSRLAWNRAYYACFHAATVAGPPRVDG